MSRRGIPLRLIASATTGVSISTSLRVSWRTLGDWANATIATSRIGACAELGRSVLEEVDLDVRLAGGAEVHDAFHAGHAILGLLPDCLYAHADADLLVRDFLDEVEDRDVCAVEEDRRADVGDLDIARG